MEWIKIVVKLITLILGNIFEKDKIKKEKKKVIIKEVKDGIKNDDPSAITGAFDSLNGL